MPDTILCVDIGTSSLKAALMTDKKEPVFVSRQNFVTGHAEEWLPALKKAVSELTQKNPDYGIEAICISGNGPTIVAESENLNAENKGCAGLKPSLCPPFANAHCPAGNSGVPSAHTFQPITLLHNEPIPSSLTLPKTKSIFIPRLLAFKQLYPTEWNKASRIFSGPEYLIYKLTGKALTILPEERFVPAYWTHEELLRCGFTQRDSDKLPPFVKSGKFAGQITAEAQELTGLYIGTLVFCGGPDFAVALIGTGTVLPGKLCDRAGSTEGLNLCTTKPVFAEGLRTLPSVSTGFWNLGKLLKAGEDFGSAVAQLKQAAEASGEYFPQEMTITGGQALNENLIQEKEKQSGLKITPQYCTDAELIGDLILARIGLGDYDDIVEGCFAMGL